MKLRRILTSMLALLLLCGCSGQAAQESVSPEPDQDQMYIDAVAVADLEDIEDEAVALSAGLMEGGAKKRCESCQKRLESGESLGDALKKSGLLPARQSRLLELGQRSGAGDASMEKIARDLSEEGEAALDALVSRVEPALVLVCSVLVGLILLSVMLPLMHIMSVIG